jgi:hypothetical protein
MRISLNREPAISSDRKGLNANQPVAGLTADTIEQVLQRLNQLWTFCSIVEVSQDQMKTAGRFPECWSNPAALAPLP